MPRRTQSNSRGFTVVEILIAVLILAVTMAVAIPAFINAIASGQRRSCRDNMQVIANAEREYKLQDGSHNYATTLASLQSKATCPAVCPSGGTYTITATGGSTFTITCSYGDHGSFTPGGTVY